METDHAFFIRYVAETKIGAAVLQCLEMNGMGIEAARLADIRDMARVLHEQEKRKT